MINGTTNETHKKIRWSLVVGRWSLVVGRWSLVVGLISVGQLAVALPSHRTRSVTWTKHHTTINNVKVYNPDGFGAVNNTNTGKVVTLTPSQTRSVVANYFVQGSVLTPPWTEKFADLETYSYTYTKTESSFYLGAMKQVSYKLYYDAEQGDERWDGVEVVNGNPVTSSATRTRDYYVSGAAWDIIVTDTPGGPD